MNQVGRDPVTRGADGPLPANKKGLVQNVSVPEAEKVPQADAVNYVNFIMLTCWMAKRNPL